MFRAMVAVLFGPLSLLAGCGYHAANSAVHLPKTVHTIAVPTFANHTQSYHTEIAFTQAVIHDLTSRTSYRVLASDDTDGADAVLHGDIKGFQVIPLTYNSQTGQSSSYLITIQAGIKLTDRDNRVLYQNPSYSFREQYETTQDPVSFIQEDPAAVSRLARSFAEAMDSDILESF